MPNLHVVPDPDSDRWLVLELTDQEAFAWDAERYGAQVALENWREIFDWRSRGRPKGLGWIDMRSG